MSWSKFVRWLGEHQEDIIAGGLRVVVILIAAYVLTRFLRRLVQRVHGKVAEHTTPIRTLQRTETLTRVLSSAGIVLIWGIALFYVLSSFGAQNLVRDVVTGFFILLEDQYGVGDIVELNEVASGKVETLTLRVSGLRALDGTMHYMANGQITHVANRSKDWARAVVDVGVGYGEDPAKVRAVLEEVMVQAKESSDLGRKLYSVPEVLGVEMLGEYEVVWRTTADVKPAKQWEVARDLRERIKVAFDEHHVEIPFPHRVMISADGRHNGRA